MNAQQQPTQHKPLQKDQTVLKKSANQAGNGIYGCGRCENRWGGPNTAHCGACHETFTTVAVFDKHRDGSHADGTRHCVDPTTAGLIDAGRPYPCWRQPANPDKPNPWATP